MGAKLLYRDAQGRDAAADLQDAGSFLGRAVECVVRTDDAMVSRRNCKLSVQGGRWVVEDLGSANGTYVTTGSGPERRIQREGLAHGDVVRCGSLQVRFVEVPDAAPIPAQPQPAAQPQPNLSASQPGAGTRDTQQPRDPEPTSSDANKPAKGPTGEGPATSGVSKGVAAEEVLKLQEEFKKCANDLEEAKGALRSAGEERDQAVAKLESLDTEVKRLRGELTTAKDAIDKLGRQAKKDKDELAAENRVNEELRQDLKQLRTENSKSSALLDDLKTQVEAKDRQIASGSEDVRRAKKEVEGLNSQLQKLARDRDEQIRNMNSQTGDTDRLRDILREREKIIEEQRVGIVNQEAQIKDLRKRAEDEERELADIKGKYDNLRERYNRGQTQIEELHQMLTAGQQGGGGDKLLQLTQENRTLRQDLTDAENELNTSGEQLKRAQAELAELTKQRDKLAETEKGSAQVTQQAVDKAVAQAVPQAVAQAVEKAVADAKAQFEVELKKLADERDQLAKDRDQLATDRDALSKQVEDLQVRDTTATDKAGADVASAKAEVASAKAEVANLQKEREVLRGRVTELEDKFKSAIVTTQAMPAGDAASTQAVAELRAVATSAYDGISDSFGGLRKNLVDLEENFNKVERSIGDKESAKRLRMSLEEVQNCFDDARSQIRSLRAVIE